MNWMRAIGLAIFVAGIAMLLFGINSTETTREKIFESATGRYTKETMFYIIGGLALIAGGLALTRKRRL